MSKINFRRSYNLFLTNTKDNRPGSGPCDLLMPTKPTFRGTPRQIMAEIRDFARLSGGCDYAAKIIDPKTGERISRDDLATELMLADMA